MTTELTPLTTPEYALEVRKEDRETATEVDFQKSRENIVSMLEIGEKAVKDFAVLADASQNPAYYEVLGNLIKVMGDSSQKLLATHEQLEKIASKRTKKTAASGDSVMVMSTADVAAALRNIEKEAE